MNASNYYSRFLLFLFAALLLIPFSALAVDACVPVVNSTKTEEIEDAFRCDSELTGITYRMTECVTQILKHVAERGFIKVLEGLKTAIFATMMMFVAFSGIKMVLGGVRNLKGETLLMLIKLAFVAYVVSPNADGLKNINNMMNGLTSGMVNLVSGQLVGSGPCSTDEAGGIEKNVWKRVDCTILAFIGKHSNNPIIIADIDGAGASGVPNGTIEEDEKNAIKEGAESKKAWPIDQNGDGKIEDHEKNVTETPIGRGPKDLNCDGFIVGIGELNADETTSTVDEKNALLEDATLFEIGISQLFTLHGIFILFLLIAATIVLFLAFAKALQYYVIAMIAITFLMLFAPIFVPLMLFQRTKKMFQTWMFMIVGYMLQPAMVIAFLVFFLSVMNVALHGTPTSDGLKQSLDMMNKNMQANSCTTKPMAGITNAMMAGNFDEVKELIQTATRKKETEVSAIVAPTTPVDYKDLSVFMIHLMGCIVLLFILTALFANVGDFIAALAGSSGGNLAKFGVGMQQISGAVSDTAKTTLGK